MLSTLRRSGVVLLWLALVLLPLRGWAFAVMQSAPPTSATMGTSAPCHGAAATDAHGEHHAPETSDGGTGAAAEGHACTLCDLCHAVALPVHVPAFDGRYLPPQVSVSTPLPLAGARLAHFKPPRG